MTKDLPEGLHHKLNMQAAFVTEDRRLLKAFPSITRTMQEIIAG